MQNFSLVFSPELRKKNAAKKITYIAVAAALFAIASLCPISGIGFQFSFKIFVAVIAGIVIGPTSGFFACFIGDLLGCLFGGRSPSIVIGIASSLFALISGIVFWIRNNPENRRTYLRLTLICLLSFLICTIAINSTYFYFLYGNNESVSYFSYVALRLFTNGQIYNSLVNYCLLFVFLPILQRVPLIKDFFR